MATPPSSGNDSGRGSAEGARSASGPAKSAGSVKKVSSNPSARSATAARPRPAGTDVRPTKRPPRPGSPTGSSNRSNPPHLVPEPAPLGEGSWRAFFRPVKSSKPGTMPAGMVLVVVVAALLVALFVSADAISRKAGGRRNNAEWRKTLATDIAKFSNTFGLGVPSKALDDAVSPLIGHERKTSQQSTEELLAAQRAADGDPTLAVGPLGSRPPSTIDRTPKLRQPTVAQPLKIWVGGDSISYEPGVALTNFSSKTKLYTVTQDARASTGLVRDDYFNWPQHLVNDVSPLKPDVVMIMFGGNDTQGVVLNGGSGGVLFGTPEWQAIYRKRVGDTMDLLRSAANDRIVIWMGMPPVSATSGVKNIEMLNYIFATEAAKNRPWVKYFDSWPFFSGTDGQFAASLSSADGSEHSMRAKDGVHFSFTGGDRMGWAVYAKFASLVDLSAAPVLSPDPTEAPPPEIRERTEIPPGEGQVPLA